jgi:dolichyl-phosphate mannosyltransferase polypeptide 3
MYYQLPLYFVVLYGCYAFFSIGIALVTFRDCPAAAVTLKQDIEDAKKDLAAKGIEIK